MQRDEVRRRVTDKAGELLELDPAALDDDVAFRALGVDSLALVECALALEDVFDVEIPEEEVAEMETFGHLVDAIVEKTSVRSAGLDS